MSQVKQIKRPVWAWSLDEKIRLNGMVNKFPLSWRAALTKRLGKWDASNRDAWFWAIHKLTDAARGGIRLDSNDADICEVAKKTADDFAIRVSIVRSAARVNPQFFARYGSRWVEHCAWKYAVDIMERRGLADLLPVPNARKGITRTGILKRLECEKFWRRCLRTLHARTVEACSVQIGRVSRDAGLYVSDDGLKRRASQNARNAAVLDSVIAVNDLGQVEKLSDLAAKGNSNKTIRRVELLTRIAGFEEIAKGMGHCASMVTMTCPSRFHAMTTYDGKTFPNKKYDGSNAIDANRFLGNAWSKFRSAAARLGLGAYGFRISEPQHDSTPHWHCILFFPAIVAKTGETGQAALERLVRRYFLDADCPYEPGAQEHRVDFEQIDWNIGSAIGYVIKYVSKNIDGFRVGADLEAGPEFEDGEVSAITSSARVDAWASTWRIRQFQQVGGPPVGVWRELRRINPGDMPVGIPDALRQALEAVNAPKDRPGVAAVGWLRYATAQGGIHCPRKDMRLRLLRAEACKAGRYGEPVADRVIGVEAEGMELFRNHVHVMKPGAAPFARSTYAAIESERCEWVVTHGTVEQAERAASVVFQRIGEADRARIHVNNCTDRQRGTVSEFARTVIYRRRLKRYPQREPAGEREYTLLTEENFYGFNRNRSSSVAAATADE